MRAEDHPRPCGEKVSAGGAQRQRQGSPPPMRGKARGERYMQRARRITPAHAGKRQLLPSSQHMTRDHPRPCGEKCKRPQNPRHLRGSPPPMRGKGGRCRRRKSRCRITPAHAGKSRFALYAIHLRQDHPRPCGEKMSLISLKDYADGSPPPMRGKEWKNDGKIADSRITPAHAGKS